MKCLMVRDIDLHNRNIEYLKERFKQYMANSEPQLMIKNIDYHPAGYTYAIPEHNPYYIVLQFFQIGQIYNFPDKDITNEICND